MLKNSLYLRFLFFSALVGGVLLGAAWVWAAQFSVQPHAETETTGSGDVGDIVDDPAVWIHPTNPSLSTIIGTDKGSAGGLNVYRLDGTRLAFYADGKMNNVDIRYRFPLGGQAVDIVVASRITDTVSGRLEIYTVDADTRLLANVTGSTALSGFEPYGLALYRSPATGRYYAFVSTESPAPEHKVFQYELVDSGAGTVDAVLARTITGISRTEGMVADDVRGVVYVGVEDEGIFKYDAEPLGGNTPLSTVVAVDPTTFPGEVEGLSLYYAGSLDGYLIASSQGSSEFYVYERQADNALVTSFNVVQTDEIDAVTSTDGVEVSNLNLGAPFSQGLFIAHDTFDTSLTSSNFKLVPWPAVVSGASGAGVTLTTDTSWNMRYSPRISIGDTAVSEGTGEEDATAVFQLTLSHPMLRPISVLYATAAGSAEEGVDYVPDAGSATFAPGQTTQTIAVSVNGDGLDEEAETFSVRLSDPTNGTLAAAEGTATIDDDDTALLDVEAAGIVEGDDASTEGRVPVVLSNPSSRTVTVAYTTADGSARAGVDYVAVSGTLTFTAGQTRREFIVPILGNTAEEPDRTFSVHLQDATNAVLRVDEAPATILDDDGVPGIGINDATALEDDAGSHAMAFTVSLVPAASEPLTVTYATADGTATAGEDYAAASGTLTFAPGETTRFLILSVLGDTRPEPDETFTVTLSGGMNAEGVDVQAVGTIIDDDALKIYLPLVIE